MSAPSVYRLFHAGPLAAGALLRLDAESSHHALRVLRLAAGDSVEVFDGRGRRCAATLLDADPRGATVSCGEPVDARTESPLALGLAQALPAGDKMDWVVEKAIELGATAIQPLFSRRSVLRLDEARAAKRLGVTQPRMNDLLRGRIDKFSLDALMILATGAGLTVEWRVAKAAA